MDCEHVYRHAVQHDALQSYADAGRRRTLFGGKRHLVSCHVSACSCASWQWRWAGTRHHSACSAALAQLIPLPPLPHPPPTSHTTELVGNMALLDHERCILEQAILYRHVQACNRTGTLPCKYQATPSMSTCEPLKDETVSHDYN